MASVLLKDLEKVYPNGFKALHGINLEINNGEFMVFVGPSGCAKSTTLRMIAGLEKITAGQVWIDDRVVNDVAPKDRDIAMVFQNYALYPHMTAYENMAFVLQLRKTLKTEIERRVKQAAEILEITPLLDRKPKQMSGGQMQRVAVGRAIVRDPKVFLFDEPLSNLDAKLRVQMRVEISKIHQKLKSTMIYVTHDQVEAMTLGDRICVMEKGVIKQVDTPTNLYHYPANIFVAQFIGLPAMNVVEATLLRQDDHYYVKTAHMTLRIPKAKGQKAANHVGKEILFGLRPEHITSRLSNQNAADNFYTADVDLVENMGNDVYVYFTCGENHYIARLDPGIPVHRGGGHEMWFDTTFCHLFDKDTQENILHRPTT